MIDWVPVIFVAFKAVVLSICMFFAIKWHYDQGRKAADRYAVLRAGGKVAGIFLLVLLGVGLFAYALANMFGLDLRLP